METSLRKTEDLVNDIEEILNILPYSERKNMIKKLETLTDYFLSSLIEGPYFVNFVNAIGPDLTKELIEVVRKAMLRRLNKSE